jgi:anti-sigma regulatory factor (Ser/Thr protein kinase)
MLELTLAAEPASVTLARHAVGGFAERVGAERQDVELAVSEAVTNSVVHAYPGGIAGTIVVQAQLRGAALIVVVRDNGTGLRPDLKNKGMGLGLPLIARVSDEYRIEDLPDGGAVVTMRFRAKQSRGSMPAALTGSGALKPGHLALVTASALPSALQ